MGSKGKGSRSIAVLFVAPLPARASAIDCPVGNSPLGTAFDGIAVWLVTESHNALSTLSAPWGAQLVNVPGPIPSVPATVLLPSRSAGLIDTRRSVAERLPFARTTGLHSKYD